MNQSVSGLIKIPKKVLDEVTLKARELLLSYAYHVTRLDRNVEKHHQTIVKMMSFYKITPIEKHLLESQFKVKVDDSDLPPSYFKFAKDRQEFVYVELDHNETRYLGAYVPPNKIIVCARKMYSILVEPSTDKDSLFQIFADFDDTIDHELTHFTQNYLHPSNKEKNYSIGPGGIDNYDAYYTSQVEFDPTVRSEVSRFSMLIVDKFGRDPKNLNNLIREFTCQHVEDRGIYESSSFFCALKRNKPDMYRQALKLFVSHVNDSIKKYANFKEAVGNIKVNRLDYVFGEMRSNEFRGFVNSINTFITYPESRLADFASLEKYLPKIDDRFKQVRKEARMFVRCNAKAIEYITKANKGFFIKTIFVDEEIYGTGMMFDISNLPMILDIDALTHDIEYIDACDDNDIFYLTSKFNFAIVDGSNFKFQKSNLLGVYIDGQLQS